MPGATETVSPLAAAARACWIVAYGQPLGQTSSVAACAGIVFAATRPAARPSINNPVLDTAFLPRCSDPRAPSSCGPAQIGKQMRIMEVVPVGVAKQISRHRRSGPPPGHRVDNQPVTRLLAYRLAEANDMGSASAARVAQDAHRSSCAAPARGSMPGPCHRPADGE